jgi:predicted MFS family arabinose efflux permease
VAATAIVLLTTWGGSQYAWGSPVIVGLALLAVASVAFFCLAETRAAEPVLPLHVFRNRNFTLSSAMSFLVGLMLFGALTFLPLYQQTVQHLSATGSGLMLIPMMFGSMVTTILAGQVTTRAGRYKIFPILGGLGMIAGLLLLLLTQLGVTTTLLVSGLYFAVLGIGMGFLMNNTTIILQNSVDPRDMGVASSGRPVRPRHGQPAAHRDPGRRVLRHLARCAERVCLGGTVRDGGVRARLVRQGSPAARPGTGGAAAGP